MCWFVLVCVGVGVGVCLLLLLLLSSSSSSVVVEVVVVVVVVVVLNVLNDSLTNSSDFVSVHLFHHRGLVGGSEVVVFTLHHRT